MQAALQLIGLLAALAGSGWLLWCVISFIVDVRRGLNAARQLPGTKKEVAALRATVIELHQKTRALEAENARMANDITRLAAFCNGVKGWMKNKS
jgi:hypothetical protein